MYRCVRWEETAIKNDKLMPIMVNESLTIVGNFTQNNKFEERNSLYCQRIRVQLLLFEAELHENIKKISCV